MSLQFDLETLTRPGGMVPVDIETTAALVRHVLRLREALKNMLVDPPATLDEPDLDWEVIKKMRAIARDALSNGE